MPTHLMSIIVPVYNVEQYLPRCIESILEQTVSDFELILVNDGSSDGSLNICNEYAKNDKHIIVLNQENKGVSAARNNGIDNAKGEWITFIDSDDFVESDYLERFQAGKDDADLIVQGLEYYDNRNGNFFKQVRVETITLEQDNFKHIIERNDLLHLGYPFAKVYRRSLLSDKIRFNTSISFHEDHIFVFEAMMASKSIRLVDTMAYKYRCFHSVNSLSRKRHPWNQLNDASNGMLTSLDIMKNRFLNLESDYCRSIFTFAYEPKLTAISELFRSSDDYNIIKKYYYSIINKENLRKMYHPQNRKGKLYKSVMLHLPFCGIYLFFKALVKYQNLNR